MRLKWFGTATIMLEQDGTRLLFDPFIPLNDKVFKPQISELASVDNIFVTHDHLDHIADLPAIMKQGNAKSIVYCTANQIKTLISIGVDNKRIHKIVTGNVYNFGPFEVRALKSKHIVYDKGLIIKTFLSPRILANWAIFRQMRKESKNFAEAGETVAYDIVTAVNEFFYWVV